MKEFKGRKGLKFDRKNQLRLYILGSDHNLKSERIRRAQGIGIRSKEFIAAIFTYIYEYNSNQP